MSDGKPGWTSDGKPGWTFEELQARLLGNARISTHALTYAIRILRGETRPGAPIGGGRKFNGQYRYGNVRACDGKETGACFTSSEAALLLENKSGWKLPTCPICMALVVGALAIRTATNPEDVKDLL